MRKIFAFLCALLLAVQFSAAQRTLYVIDKDGKLSAYSAATVSFSDDVFSDDAFSFTNGDVTGVSKESFSASFQVAFKSDEIKNIVQAEVGVCYSKENSLPTINDDCQTLGSSFESYSFTLYPLIYGTTYYWRPYVKLGNAVCYGEIGEETTLGTKPDDKIINGHKFLDLGLPSGLLWAETNIGAETAADDGGYYAWGETTPKNYYSWATYKYGKSYNKLTKYNSTDGKTILENADDAAYVNWGSSCRMPTCTEFKELLNFDNCTWTWTSMKNSSGSSVKGCKVTSKKNGNFIFLPASGCRSENRIYDYGSCDYWSSALSESYFDGAYYLYFYSSDRYTKSDSRYNGRAVRPVAAP